MKLINPSLEIYTQEPGLTGMYKQIEKCARVSYKSEDRIDEHSYKKFLKMLYDRGHLACFEHGTVYLKIPFSDTGIVTRNYYGGHPMISPRYSSYAQDGNFKYITTNLRVLLESNDFDLLKYICEPTEYHEKRICVKFTLSNGIAREFCRHRVFSFMMESTRYCNYSQDRFSNDITYIIPSTLEIPEGKAYWHDGICFRVAANEENFFMGTTVRNKVISDFLHALNQSEKSYMNLIEEGQPAQVARDVLPLALKTELVMTGTISQWKEFFKLRCDKAAHPDAQYLANLTKNEFIKRGYIDE